MAKNKKPTKPNPFFKLTIKANTADAHETARTFVNTQIDEYMKQNPDTVLKLTPIRQVKK